MTQFGAYLDNKPAKGGVHLRVQMFLLFRISETASRIALNFGLWLKIH